MTDVLPLAFVVETEFLRAGHAYRAARVELDRALWHRGTGNINSMEDLVEFRDRTTAVKAAEENLKRADLRMREAAMALEEF